MSTRQPQEIDWDRIDKTKFFFVGIGAFSGVTTLLYPLSVIKTNLQAAHGGQTTAQTTAMIWKTRGLRGFYRGFATVVFGTIPARMVYLSSLEMTKSAVNKTGQHLGVDATVLAGSSNFVAGAISSLITQVITVPMDVVSQRQMVHSSGGAPGPAAAAPSGASAPAQAPGVAPAAPGVTQAPGASSSSVPSSSSSSTRGGAAGGQGHARMHTSALDATMHHSLGAGRQRQQQQQAVETPSCKAGDAGRQATHRHATTTHGASSHNFQNTSTAGAGAGSQRSLRSAQPAPGAGSCSRTIATSARLAGVSGGSGAAAGAPGGGSALQIVRVILKEEGVLGLYRGFGASIITYVPSSAVWWGCYGLYQKLAWNMLGGGPVLSASPSAGASPAAAGGALALSSSSPSGSGSGAGGGGGAAAVAAGAAPSTMDVVLVQTSASCLAGMTSAGITSPLDLIKTRIQVAQRQQGQAVTFRAVFAEVLREDGWLGFFRAAGPRMANSALWGTAMMSVYEALKRLSVKD